MKYILAALGTCFAALSQGQGVGADWDIVPVIQALSQNSGRLSPIVEQVTPRQWISKGAPEAYVSQWETAKREIASVSAATQVLERDPEKLTVALDIYFRLQLIETQLKTLAEGVRQYQNPAVADLMLSVLSENSISRDRLQRHIMDVAEQKEREFSVIDKEAQRCREQVIRQVPTRAPAPPKKAKQ